MSSPPITGTDISASAYAPGSWEAYYQLSDGKILQERIKEGGATTNTTLTIRPIESTPIAATTFKNGEEVRLFYLDSEHYIKEWIFSATKGWSEGGAGAMKAKANPTAGLAVVAYMDGGQDHHLRVYYQDAETNLILELEYVGWWRGGTLRLGNAFNGTSIAAAVHDQKGPKVHLYHQREDLTIDEHYNYNGGWHNGSLQSGKVTSRTPLSALAYSDGGQLYWRNAQGSVVFSKYTGSSWSSPNIIEGVVPGYQFAAVQWGEGKHLRLKYQETTSYVAIYRSDDGGQHWEQA